MDDKEFQKKNLEAIYSSASMAPVFKQNSKYCVGTFAELIPYISYNDIMNYKFIIRGRNADISNRFFAEPLDVIAEYDSIDSLVNDGWRLD